MKNLIIIGARGFGREVFNLARKSSDYQKKFSIKGFLDDKTDALDRFDNYPPIIESAESYIPQKNDLFVCALGNVHDKKYYSKLILEKGGIFFTLVAPKCDIPDSATIGAGCIISTNSIISVDTSIGDFVTVSAHTVIGHDVKIGSWSSIGPMAFLGGFVEVEPEVQVHAKATILPDLKIGQNSTIGAGSVVINNVRPNKTVFGNPAKLIN